MATILKGAPVVATMNRESTERCAALIERGVPPTLAIVRIGAREDDLSYETGMMKRCAKIGVAVRQYQLPEDAEQQALLDVIAQINADPAIHGCMLFRPLPKQMNDAEVRAALDPAKDVDGITDASLAGVFTNSGVGFAPCTAQACLELLHHYEIPLTGKRAAVLGRSLVIGKPVAMLLDRENATVTVCHTRTRDVPSICREADIVVAAIGKIRTVDAAYLRPGQVVVDVGIHVDDDGKLCGDVEPSALEQTEAYTPVPGGVGTVTTSVLVRHVIEAAERTLKNG